MKRSQASELVGSLYESWAPFLLRYAIRFGGSREWAEDLVQEALMTLYQRLREGQPIENPRGWTLRFVRNQMAKHWRDQGRKGEHVGVSALNQTPVSPTNPDLPDWDELSRLFSVLSRREEEVIMLRLQAMKYREIAQELGISPNTVAPLLARALKKLQKEVKGRSWGSGSVLFEEGDVPETLQ